MASIKQINVKIRRRCFFKNLKPKIEPKLKTKIKNFDSNLLKIDKKSYKNINTYYND